MSYHKKSVPPVYQRDGTPCAANAAHSSKRIEKRLAVPGLTSRKKSGRCFFTPAGDRKGKTARTDTLYPPCPVPVPIKIKKSCLVPYCQAAGLPYCSPPAREYPSRLRLHKRHDTDSRWRQVTKLPRPCPQYPPFTLRYGNNWFSFTGGSWRSRRCHAPVTGPPGCRSCL